MTVLSLGLDYSAGYPGGAAIRAAGYRFVVRYLDNALGGGRANLTAAEVKDLRANDVEVALVWERKLRTGPDRVTLGRPAGMADAQAANAQAQAVGLDAWPIYFAIDYDIPDFAPAATSPRAKLGPAADYFDGVATVLPHNRIGVYGGYWAVSRVLDAGLASLAWQASAWSGGKVDPRRHLFQRVSSVFIGSPPIECDVSEQLQPYYGQGPVNTPAQPPDTEDDDMAPKPVFYQADGYDHGLWRDEFGVYVGLASDNEKNDLLAAFPDAVKGSNGDGVWIEKATADELVRISRVGVDTPAPTSPATPVAGSAS